MEFAHVRLRTYKGSRDGPPSLNMPKLSNDKRYMISLDQSTSCTGIGIGQIGLGMVAMLEVESRSLRRQDYVHGLYDYLKSMLYNKQVVGLLIEDVFEGTNPKTYQILAKLRNTLLTLKKNGVRGRIERINNLVWKSELFTGLNERNMYTRNNSKRLARQVMLDKYPWSDGLVEDGYDAGGMLEAYMSACFNSDWSLQQFRNINKFIYTEDRHMYDFEIIHQGSTSDLVREAAMGNFEVMHYNTSLTPKENAMLATSISKKLVVTEPIPESNWHAIFCMQNNVKWNKETEFRLIAKNRNVNGRNFFEA